MATTMNGYTRGGTRTGGSYASEPVRDHRIVPSATFSSHVAVPDAARAPTRSSSSFSATYMSPHNVVYVPNPPNPSWSNTRQEPGYFQDSYQTNTYVHHSNHHVEGGWGFLFVAALIVGIALAILIL